MSVIQRCPSCGTTQPASGVCTTCHEAEVRYFCTDHTPGVWLDGPTCPRSAEHPARRPEPPRSRAARSDSARSAVTEPAAIPISSPRARLAIEADRPSFPAVAADTPALWESVLRGAMVARRGSESVTRASSWLSKLVRRLVMIALLLGLGLVALIYVVARSLG